MAVHLDNLPPELILHLIDSGGLEVQDGLALRQTCKALHEVTESRLFWLSLIRNCQEMGYAMPFPPFRKVSTLSTSELIRVAIKFVLIGNNLASPGPQFRSHRILALGEEESFPSVERFTLLANGHYALILHEESVCTLWDVRPTGALGLGGLLARHEVPEQAVYMAHTTEGGDGTCVVVATLSGGIGLPKVSVFQFQLDFSSVGSSQGTPEVIQSDLAEFRIQPVSNYARIALQEGLCLAWYDSEPLERRVTASISIFDYRNSKRMDFETGITAVEPPDACIYHGNLLFYHDKLASSVVDAYFDITQHLQSVTINSRPGDVDMIHKAPDRSAVLPLQPPDMGCRAHQEPNLIWKPRHPPNTPSANTRCGSPSIFITETLSPGHGWTPHWSARWMQPRETLNMLRTGANTDAPLSRTWIDPKGRPRVQEDETEFLRATTCGLRMLWAGRPEDGDSEGGDDEGLSTSSLFLHRTIGPGGMMGKGYCVSL